MSFTLVQSKAVDGTGGGDTSVDIVFDAAVGAGNIVVLVCGMEGAGALNLTGTNGAAQGHDFTANGPGSNGDAHLAFLVWLNGAATATYTANFSSHTFSRFIGLEFSYTGGTPSIDGALFSQEDDTALNSGDLTVAGTDVLGVGAFRQYTATTTSSEQIDGNAATGVVRDLTNESSAWYRNLNPASSPINATATIGVASSQVGGVLGISLSAAAATAMHLNNTGTRPAAFKPGLAR